MTKHVVRAYAAAAAVLVLFLAWAVISANPWATPEAKVDQRLTALNTREAALRREAVQVQRLVKRRETVYRIRLASRNRQIAQIEQAHQRDVAAAKAAAARAYSAPSVSVVRLPAMTVTRTS